ncbi:protein-L-isoaspartate(D-aspartate) O-methyltransferase [Brucella tritici]|uniref:protein-L-isoaspartate(D-aspartate) O-methyltransferase n=1 Tax=Brucella tritici TaxID=94626 RepID=UPI0015902FCB|nr:protein-L-isoaspartate(D-aspartate) O-methyltransferase [Brucella tritici]
MRNLEKARVQMVEQLVHHGIHDTRVLEAMGTVAREKFIDEGFIEFAYEDTPLPIKNGQTISQPYMTAFMIAAARLGEAERVLEIGTGSGYAAAIMAQIAGQIFTVERYSTLAEAAQQRFEDLGCNNIHVRTGDGSNGWPEVAPFDAIIVAAGAPDIPQSLKEQLKTGGRLIIPVGSMAGAQRLLRITRKSTVEFDEEDLGGVMFVPLVGDKAWPDMD